VCDKFALFKTATAANESGLQVSEEGGSKKRLTFIKKYNSNFSA
jgi:hypothetical protein